MAREITVPRLGWTMEEGTFGGWLKADGETVREGDELFLLESDKASEAVTALDAGTLRIPANGPAKGDTVQVGQCLGYLVAPGEALPLVSAPAPAVAPTTRSEPTPVERTEVTRRVRPTASPRARRVAQELGVDLAGLRGSGRTGRIVERDVRAAAPAAATERRLPVTPLRRLIAERMSAGVRTTAPVTLTTKADATRLRDFRERHPDAVRPSYTELLIERTARVLQRHPLLNTRWEADSIVVSTSVHMAVAIDTDAGLVAPVVRDAHALSLAELRARLRELAERARQGRLRAEEVHGGTFTLTNLGMYGIDAFTPILNVPQVAILGVGRVVLEPAVFEGQIVPRAMMALSLTFDHRAVDGGPAARFLDDLRRTIEAGD